MLTIRDAQLRLLERGAETQFVERVMAALAAEDPEGFASRGEAFARHLVRDGIEWAAGYQIRGEGAVEVLIGLTWDVGRRLELSPDRAWAHDVLAHPALPEGLKAEIVAERLTARTRGRTVVVVDDATESHGG